MFNALKIYLLRGLLGLLLLQGLTGCATSLLVGSALGTGAAGVMMYTDRRAEGVSAEDDALVEQILQRLQADSGIAQAAHIQVFSYNHQVLLAGEAPNEAVRQQAAALAAGVSGVREVYNQLIISPPATEEMQSFDSQLRIRINAALLFAQGLTAAHPHITVANGVAYVMGLLTREEGNSAVEVVRYVDGVTKVVPLIEYVRLVESSDSSTTPTTPASDTYTTPMQPLSFPRAY